MGELTFAFLRPGGFELVIAVVPVVILLLVVLLIWLVARRVGRWISRSIKTRRDLARGIADVADKLEKIEGKLEGLSQEKSTSTH